jgi:hypothetical protein
MGRMAFLLLTMTDSLMRPVREYNSGFRMPTRSHLIIKALDSFQTGTSTVSQILSENIQVMFNRILIRLPLEAVYRSLGFIVAFACGLVHVGMASDRMINFIEFSKCVFSQKASSTAELFQSKSCEQTYHRC